MGWFQTKNLKNIRVKLDFYSQKLEVKILKVKPPHRQLLSNKNKKDSIPSHHYTGCLRGILIIVYYKPQCSLVLLMAETLHQLIGSLSHYL